MQRMFGTKVTKPNYFRKMSDEKKQASINFYFRFNPCKKCDTWKKCDDQGRYFSTYYNLCCLDDELKTLTMTFRSRNKIVSLEHCSNPPVVKIVSLEHRPNIFTKLKHMLSKNKNLI